MSKVVGVEIDGVVEWHAINPVAGVDYTTMCGVDSHDITIGHTGTVRANKGQKITCRQCYQMWAGITSLKLKESSFDV